MADKGQLWAFQVTATAGRPRVARVQNTGTAESSGIVRLEDTDFGPGWWALDVHGHQNLEAEGGFFWDDGPSSLNNGPYSKRLEDGQLLLMYIPGS